MVFIPLGRSSRRRMLEERIERDEEMLLMGGGDAMNCNSILGSDIKIKETKVSTYGLDNFRREDFIPQDKRIISIQILPYEVSYGTVREWSIVVLYEENDDEEVKKGLGQTDNLKRYME